MQDLTEAAAASEKRWAQRLSSEKAAALHAQQRHAEAETVAEGAQQKLGLLQQERLQLDEAHQAMASELDRSRGVLAQRVRVTNVLSSLWLVGIWQLRRHKAKVNVTLTCHCVNQNLIWQCA